ncbi:MAG TPA: hypothetical protein PK677_05375 [Acidiphilium sp.]|nr:MAG: hypothetical protein B7Z67_05290 [Acidiphilium sp. 21-60-14]OYV92537.1 MAG: hypothetical protein B7Z57_00455 [Acidiphilium sp. 37-60-79]OZB40988.1 MAG: hypothetical protein B7X48_02780 [Acidiphilium sp. 34-60-192]HQT87969.1 hypothetical protein [Acidiphilium sp.]HQU22741.1 hypothetical protein [Acidiphilium sp.]
MDGLRLADRIAYGGGMAARKAGVICDAYRAIDGSCPLVSARRIVRLGVLSIPAGGGIRSPAGFGVPFRQLVLDQAYVLAGDYLVGPGGTYLVATNEAPAPALGVQCNEVITLWRTATPAVPGLNPYGAVLLSDARVVLAGFPAALTPGGVSDRTRLGLPDDTKLPGYVAVVAAVDGAGPLVADILRDGRGRQFVVDAAARFGGVWRLALTESVA